MIFGGGVSSGVVSGADTPWHAFPATVRARGTVRLLITIYRPDPCQTAPGDPTGTVLYRGFHVMHWNSLLHSHATYIDDGVGERELSVC